jgi:hypothetical protein
MVAIASAGVAFRETKAYRELPALITEHGRVWENPPDTFKDAGTSVRTVSVYMQKPEATDGERGVG